MGDIKGRSTKVLLGFPDFETLKASGDPDACRLRSSGRYGSSIPWSEDPDDGRSATGADA